MSSQHTICVLFALAAAGCGPGTTTRNKIGDACTAPEMTQGNCETGAFCIHGSCTKPCSQQGGDLHPSDGTFGGCPVGFDCGLAAPMDAMATCYRASQGATCDDLLKCAIVAAADKQAMYAATYGPGGTCAMTKSANICAGECAALLTDLRKKSMDPACTATAAADSKNYGVDCSTVAKGCSTAANPCADGFTCLAELKCDPDAYCTRACAADADCPPTFFCGTQADGSHVCMRRVQCSDCAVDDQCPVGYFCAVDGKGGRFCGKACQGAPESTDCPQPMNGASHFVLCKTDGLGRQVCTPTVGYCHGPSAISGQPDGGICAMCRVGVPSDCTAAGAKCVEDKFSTERFCSIMCTVTVTSGGLISADSCPEGTYCDLGGAAGAGTYKSVCAGDPSYQGVTCYP